MSVTNEPTGDVVTVEAGVVLGAVTDRPLDLAAHEAAVADRRAGAPFSAW